ncbi:MAG: hypothetical protein ACREEM_01950 [Blastocatellia bacterium]
MTPDLSISHLEISSDSNSFQVTYLAEHQQGETDFFWRADIRGTAQGKLMFSMDGEARSTFLRNRIGFCLLHSTHSLKIAGLTLRRDGKTRTMLANLTAVPQTLIVEGLSDDVSIAELNENNITQAMISTEEFRAQPSQYLRSHFGQLEVTLLPYAISRIDMT